MTSNPAISVDSLRVSYRGKRGEKIEAVRGLSFEVERGEIVGFLGPNGAGKSSTLKALMGFVMPEGGSCSIFGLPAGSLAAKSKVGYLPEVAMYYPYLTPVETLRLYGELQGIGAKSLELEIDELLERVGLGQARRKLNRTLSKGMLQRVGIAQSLLGSPEVLVLDEVTSGLDPVGRRELRELLLERRDRGCTLFFSSHELSEVDMLCDRILLLNGGVLVDQRPLAKLRESLQRFELVYRGTVSLLGLSEDWNEGADGLVRARFAGKRGLLEALDRARTANAEIIDFVASEGSLEDFFVDSIRRVA